MTSLALVAVIAALPLIVWPPRANDRGTAVLHGSVRVLALMAVPLSLWASAWPWTVSLLRAAILLWSLVVALRVAAWRPARASASAGPIWLPIAAAMGLALWAVVDLPVNERAGAVAPLAIMVLAGSGLVSRWRGWWGLVGVTLAGVVVATGSRGGRLALVAGLVTVAALTLRQPRWMRWTCALVARQVLVATAMVVTLSGALVLWAPSLDTHLIESFVFDGSPQGWQWDVVLTGRPRIWAHAGHVLADGGITGVGLGMFGTVARDVYALALGPGPLEDAHSLPLQVLLDLGVVGLLAWLVIAFVTIRQAVRNLSVTGRGEPRRWEAAALCGALAATVVFNLADAVAPGTVAGVGSWLLVGAVFARPAQSPGRDVEPPISPRVGPGWWRQVVVVGVVAGALAGVWMTLPAVRAAVRLDLVARDAVRGLLRDDPVALRKVHDTLADGLRRDALPCRAGWLTGRVLHALDDPRRNAVWHGVMACAPGRVALMATIAPRDRDLAREATRRRPALAVAHVWLARAQGRRPDGADRNAAIRSYRRSLALDPHDGRVWRELGDRLADQDPRAAMAAYAGSCRHGDPGANGCLLAGAMAYRLGEIDRAIDYLEASRWPPARARAKTLAAERRSGRGSI